MKRFASNRLFLPHMGMIMRNQVVEIDENSGEVVSYYPFTGEMCFTEWLGGLIVISGTVPSISDMSDMSGKFGDDSLIVYIDDNKELRSVSSGLTDNTLLKAYHVTDFNVADMRFSDTSRVVQLV